MSFAGKSVFITGASRGIGKAIALRLARDGAHIAIAAKTAEPHPKLPGTIYSAAEEIEAAGGQALPLIVDVRDETLVSQAIEETVKTFGGLDILINNASAIQLTGTLQTDMKRFDLMHQVNFRGTYMCSQKAIPHLKKAGNPHILNISPPLNIEKRWFAPHVAYTMAKYGMSFCTFAMSEEFRQQGIAVNSLWPRTAIATAAINMLGGEAMMQRSRKPEIMADAAAIILARDSRTHTGQFYLDDSVLAEAGITDLAPYAVRPGGELMPDFFI
ncbi:MAG: NAD(P)-dependent oxidoreductase [Bacteroidetes bacterium]|nr:MAG: NAD(P)-dependent oxidoreductase [Bacteroidota bacterium]